MSKSKTKKPRSTQKPKVALIMGSLSDLKVMNEAKRALQEFKISCHVEIVSAHRTPEKMMEFANSAQEKGFAVIIAGAGGAAHLPGMVASLTTLPVIGVPVNLGALDGLDALLSVVQMPRGVPVASVAIDNAYNAGLLAVQILAIHDPKLTKTLEKFKRRQILKVSAMNRSINRSKNRTMKKSMTKTGAKK